jgi:glycosidase
MDFPGGWSGDSVNKFTVAGRTVQENEIFNYVRTLANFRKSSSAIKTGKLMQFVPEDWVYTYFRYNDMQTVMVVMNTSKEVKTIDPKRFEERTKGFTKGKDVITSSVKDLSQSWNLPGKSIWVLELTK